MYPIITDIQIIFCPIAHQGTANRYVQHCLAILERKVLYVSLLTLSFFWNDFVKVVCLLGLFLPLLRFFPHMETLAEELLIPVLTIWIPVGAGIRTTDFSAVERYINCVTAVANGFV